MTTTNPSSRRRPDLESVFTINEDGSRNFLHPADSRGRWKARKTFVFTLLVLISALLPWIEVGGHPAVWIDIAGRRAFLMGRSFTNQDFYLTFFLISGAGFGLIVLTSLWGRVWCGFACPQTVWMEGVFRPIERLLEGPREIRIRRNHGPWTGDWFLRKGVKHLLFLALSWTMAHLFLAYFIPVRELLHALRSSPAQHPTAFAWMAIMTAVLYFDFAWFREQTCLVVCPYGRLQSALIDGDTVIIGYDAKRGEPRGKWGRRQATASIVGAALSSVPPGSTFETDCRWSAWVAPAASTPATRSWNAWNGLAG